MVRRRVGWAWLCCALGACAQLGGFEDFTPGNASGGTPATQSGSGGVSPTAAGASAQGGSGALGGSVTGGGAAGNGEGGAPPEAGGSGGGGGGGGDGDGGGGGGGGGGGDGDGALLTDCVLLMHFEEASWSMKADEVRDSSGLGNHGTPATASLTTSTLADGKFGRAAKLDGSGGVVVADAPSLRAAGALTVAAWIYPTALDPSGPGIINKRRGFGSDTSFALFLYGEGYHLHADVQGEESRFYSLAAFGVNEWHHVALVFDGSAPASSRSRLYVDGVLDVSSAEPSTQIEPYTSELIIGDLVGGGARFSGFIDEVVVWTRALSAPEIHEVFAAPEPL